MCIVRRHRWDGRPVYLSPLNIKVPLTGGEPRPYSVARARQSCKEWLGPAEDEGTSSRSSECGRAGRLGGHAEKLPLNLAILGEV